MVLSVSDFEDFEAFGVLFQRLFRAEVVELVVEELVIDALSVALLDCVAYVFEAIMVYKDEYIVLSRYGKAEALKFGFEKMELVA